MSEREFAGREQANPLTTWDSHVTLTRASVSASTLLRHYLSEPRLVDTGVSIDAKEYLLCRF